jgi:hypothetical protein
MFKSFVAGDYGRVAKYTCLCLQFKQPWFANHTWYMLCVYKCGLEVFNCWALFERSTLVGIPFPLRILEHRQPWHHMWHLLFSSLSSIRTWDKLNGEILAANSTHCKVNWIDRVGSFGIDKYNGWCNSYGSTESARQWRNYSSKFAEDILIS